MKHLLAAVALLASSVLEAELEVAVTPRQLTLGDRAEVTLSVRLPDDLPGNAVSLPEWSSALGSAEILEVGPAEIVTLKNGQRVLRQTLGIAFFEVGGAVIPSISIEVATATGPRTLSSDEVEVDVVSVLPQGEAEPAIKPPAPPQRLAFGERFWWAFGALLVTCGFALGLLITQNRRQNPEFGGRARLSPREELDQALSILRSQSDVLALHAGVSITARRYLGRVFDFPAPESTTSEIHQRLRQRHLDADLVRQTHRLLASCDMVKFARRAVELEQGRERVAEVESIADATESWLHPDTPSDSSVEQGLRT